MVAITSNSIPAYAAPSRRPRPQGGLRLVDAHRPAAAVRLDDVRRPALALLLAVVAFLGVAGLVMSEPLAEPGTIAVSEATHLVVEGDTMWSIALDVAPAGQAAAYVERLVEVNGGATILPGQVLRLPAR